jgi:hypothetical protein
MLVERDRHRHERFAVFTFRWCGRRRVAEEPPSRRLRGQEKIHLLFLSPPRDSRARVLVAAPRGETMRLNPFGRMVEKGDGRRAWRRPSINPEPSRSVAPVAASRMSAAIQVTFDSRRGASHPSGLTASAGSRDLGRQRRHRWTDRFLLMNRSVSSSQREGM